MSVEDVSVRQQRDRREAGQLTLPQFGIFAQGTHAHRFLEFDLKPGVTADQALAAFCELRTPDVSAGGVNLVLALGDDLWRAVAPGMAPWELGPFEPVVGRDGNHAPAAQHDAWLWISGAEPDVTWSSARVAAEAVSGAAELANEVDGFTYRGGRDITGFIDGTANRQVRTAAEVAIIPPGFPGAGGSHVLAMRWIHDLEAFNRLPRAEQEHVFGRTKFDSVELSADEKPVNAHISRVETSVEGSEVEIFRRSVPYGTASEHGLYFLAFSAERWRYDLLLARMFGTGPDEVRDRLTDFSRPVTGAYYFAPSQNALNELAGQK
jgi:putative iron-dependent peroxidase